VVCRIVRGAVSDTLPRRRARREPAGRDRRGLADDSAGEVVDNCDSRGYSPAVLPSAMPRPGHGSPCLDPRGPMLSLPPSVRVFIATGPRMVKKLVGDRLRLGMVL